MERPDDPPGPANPGVMLIAIAAGAVVPLMSYLGRLVGPFDSATCVQSVTLAPDLLSGGLIALVGTLLLVLPLWWMMGGRTEAVLEDDSGLLWDRPRFASWIPIAVLFAIPAVLGMGMSAAVPNNLGSECSIREYTGGSHTAETSHLVTQTQNTCGDPSLDPTLAAACRNSMVLTSVLGGGAVGGIGFLATLAWRSRRSVSRIEIDERGVVLDGERLAYTDLDAVSCTGECLRFELFDGTVRKLFPRPNEVDFARYVAAKISPMLPTKTEDRRVELARLEKLVE